MEIGGCGVNSPVAGVMPYSERVWEPTPCEPLLATNIQLSSLRIAIEFAPGPADTFEGLSGVKEPVVGVILNEEIIPDAVSTTYRKLPYASTANGPGALPGETAKGEALTGSRL